MSAAVPARQEEAAVAPRKAAADEAPFASVEVLQDILYDMLATGIDDHASVTQADIEGFLHEHAREAKSIAEFREFFERHGLRADGVGFDSTILELPPITTVREPQRLTVERPIELTVNDLEEIPWQVPAPPLPPARRAGWTRPVWFALAALGVFMILAAWRGYVMIHDLRSDLSAATERNQRDHHTLQRLSDQAASLESSVNATGELIQRVDQKSDLLLDSLMPPAKPKADAHQRGN